MKKKLAILFLLLAMISVIISVPIVLFTIRNKTSIPLPSPDINGTISIEDALLCVNQTKKTHPNEILTLQEIGQLLWSMQGITHGQKRTAPSAGALYPLELFFYSFATENLQNALYHYSPEGHLLDFQQECNLTKNDLIRTTTLNESSINDAQAVIFVAIVPERTTIKYGLRGIQYIHLEIGHVLSNLYLQAISTEVLIQPDFLINQTQIKGITGIEEEIVVVIPISKCESYDFSTPSDTQLESIFGGTVETNDLTVEQALYLRQSTRDFDNIDFNFQSVKRLFWYAFANKEPWSINTTKPLTFTNESAVSLFVISNNELLGLDEGIFEITRSNFNFSILKLGNYIDSLYTAGLSQSVIRIASFNSVLFLNTSLLSQSEGELIYERGLYEIGMLSQFLYLESRNLNIGMVVIGAFYDNQVTALLDDYPSKPVYIIPFGPSSLSNKNQLFLTFSNQTACKILGIITLVFFYIASFLATSVIRKRFEETWLKVHHIFSTGFSILFLFGHVFLINNVLSLIQSSQTNSVFIEIGKKLIGYQLQPFDSLYSFGLLCSIIAFWLMIVLNCISFLFYKLKKIPQRIRKLIHQMLLIILLSCIYFHTYVNCLTNTLQYWLFFTVNLIIICAFMFVQYYQTIKNIGFNLNQHFKKQTIDRNSKDSKIK